MDRSSIRCAQIWAPKDIGEAADAVSTVVNSPSGFSDRASKVPFFEKEVVEEDLSQDQRDLTSRDARGHSALLRIQELC